jgi:uncharacterized membrane protein YkvA (DUF1232 family)
MPKKDHPGLLRATQGYLRDPSVSLWRKLIGLAGVAYVVWPLDVIPDVIPVLGWLDDVGVLSVVTWFVVREIRKHARRAQVAEPPQR